MKRPAIDLEKLQGALRRLSRADLLVLAVRSTELVAPAKLQALLGDRLRLEDFARTTSGAKTLLAEVQRFHAASLRGDYYESFDVNSRNFMERSAGTEAFMADFERLLDRCVQAVEKGRKVGLREAFELLFGLLRHIDEGHDDVTFFADEGGSWQLGVEWRTVLPAYFQCLAEGASPEEFAREVDRTIKAFAERERPRYLTAARRVASVEQKAALRARLAG